MCDDLPPPTTSSLTPSNNPLTRSPLTLSPPHPLTLSHNIPHPLTAHTQLAAEVVFLESLVSVVKGYPVADPRQLDSTIINWILRHQEFVPLVTDPDVRRLRDLVCYI